MSARTDRLERCGLVAAITLLALALLPMLVLGKGSCVIVHDDMDSSLARFAITAQPGIFFAGPDVPVPNVMNGQPRVCFPPALTLVSLLFFFLKPWTAYLVNEIVVRGFAFAGMLTLVEREIAPGSTGRLLGPWLALGFAVLPFYCLFGLSVAGMPLLACCLLSAARRRYRVRDFAFLAVYGFYSSLVLVGVFVIITGLGAAMVLWARTAKFPGPLMMAVGLLAVCYGIVEHQLILATLSGRFILNRVEIALPGETWANAYSASRNLLLNGQYHVTSAHRLMLWALLPAVGLGFWIRHPRTRVLAGLALAAVAIAVFYGLYNWQGIRGLLPVRWMNMFQSDRFYFFYPLIWYAILGCELTIIFDAAAKVWPLGPAGLGVRCLAAAIAACQIGIAFAAVVPADGFAQGLPPYRSRPDIARRLGVLEDGSNELYHSMRKWLGCSDRQSAGQSYASFYDERLFSELGRFIGRPKPGYRVVSIGLHPSVALLNGFYTLDAYVPLYLVDYKHRFRRIIAAELAKDPALANYFDRWGSRCYVFVHELKPGGSGDGVIEDLDLDWRALREMGGEYVFSVLPIADNPNLTLLKSFPSTESARRIYLYGVSPTPRCEPAREDGLQPAAGDHR